MIDIIIPIYNVDNFLLFQCLSSISCQTFLSNCKIIIVDDGSNNKNYLSVINYFTQYINLNILRYEHNQGPGVARQYGINHSNSDYIIFVDSDDIFYNIFSIQTLYETIKNNPDIPYVSGTIYERDLKSNTIQEEVNDVFYVTGKIYNRHFLDINKIVFHPTIKKMEDANFNDLISLYCEQYNINPIFISQPIYIHNNYNTSLMNLNYLNYLNSSECDGKTYIFIEGVIFNIHQAQQNNINNQIIKNYILNTMIQLYWFFIESHTYDATYGIKILELYYNKFYIPIYSNYNYKQSDINKAYTRVTNNHPLHSINPIITFNEFLTYFISHKI